MEYEPIVQESVDSIRTSYQKQNIALEEEVEARKSLEQKPQRNWIDELTKPEGKHFTSWISRGFEESVLKGIGALKFIKDTYEGKVPEEAVRSEGPAHMASLTGWLTQAGVATAPFRKGTLGIFGGMKAHTADVQKRVQASKLEMAGESTDTIWQKTGWERNPSDNLWRTEIPGSEKAAAYQSITELKPGEIVNLPEVIKYPELFEAYPFLKKMKVWMLDKGSGFYAQYMPTQYRAGIRTLGRIELTSAVIKKGPEEIRTVLLHEIQHAIQQYEDFGSIGSSREFIVDNFVKAFSGRMEKAVKEGDKETLDKIAEFKEVIRTLDNPFKSKDDFFHYLYMKDPGEIEARLTEIRARMPPEDKKFFSPEATRKDIEKQGYSEYKPALEMEGFSTSIKP